MAWLTVCCSKTAVRELMRVAWRTVGSIITWVSADAMAGTDRSANVPRIGIGERHRENRVDGVEIEAFPRSMSVAPRAKVRQGVAGNSALPLGSGRHA